MVILVPVYHPFLGEGARNSQENERSHSIAMRKARIFVSLVPRLSPRANENTGSDGKLGGAWERVYIFVLLVVILVDLQLPI